ncbi:YDG/SRA domain-containing protein [Microbispora bryophytorum]|uniref:caspase, EACC1-associated type n=1 Tax=Microbispora bryophytorum TaxID=1460882 RepID=UPI0033CAA3D3
MKSRAVLIGVSGYEQLTPLPAVANNLTALKELFLAPDLCGLPPEYVTVVHNPSDLYDLVHPIREAVEAAEDMLLVYYAGHGIINPDGEGLLLSTASSDRDNTYLSVNYGYIRSQLRVSRARRIIVILDCCYSGRALDYMGLDDAPAIQLANVAELSGTYLMAASSENEPAKSGETYTAFSGEFIKLVREGIPEASNLLTLGTLFEHIDVALRDAGHQTPQQREKDRGGALPVFRNRAYGKSKGLVEEGRFGSPVDVFVGRIFARRRELYDAGVHRELRAGICGTARRGGAESIVVSGGYKDDEDYGDVILYTGHGGRDLNTGVQVEDQKITDRGNAALVKSMTTGMPVRVIRGAGGSEEFSPEAGYSYDGLYIVTNYWTKVGLDGYKILQFRLGKHKEIPDELSASRPNYGRWDRVAEGIYADRVLASQLKRLYGYSCQICSTTLELPGGTRLAAAVYIKELQDPHRGPDTLANMLCLCLNHMELFRLGAIVIRDDLTVVDQASREEVGKLFVKHPVTLEYLKYHRDHHAL